MSLLLVSTAVLEGSNMTIGLTLEQAQIEGYAGTTTGAIFPTTNRACGYGVNRDYPAVEGDYIDSYTVYGKNADAGDEDFTIAVYDVSIGDLVAGSALTATIPPFTISPAKFTFDHVANTPLVAGTTYRVVAVAAGAQNVDFGNNFSVSGKTSEYQTATITNTLNDPFNPDTVHSQDLIMAAAVVNAPISGSPTLTTPYPDKTYLIGESVSINTATNISGETSLSVTTSAPYQGGLSESGGTISGTAAEVTGTIIVTVTGTNSYGSVSDSFQLTTLTTGAPSTGINVPINE